EGARHAARDAETLLAELAGSGGHFFFYPLSLNARRHHGLSSSDHTEETRRRRARQDQTGGFARSPRARGRAREAAGLDEGFGPRAERVSRMSVVATCDASGAGRGKDGRAIAGAGW